MLDLINSVRDQVATDGGHVTFPFSQSLPPISTLIGGDPATAAGICQGLVNRWIVAHARGGSLWNEMFGTDARGRHTMDIQLIQRIAREQVAGGAAAAFNQRGGAVAQLRANERYMAVSGLIPWEDPVTKIYGRAGGGDTKAAAAKQLRDALLTFKPTDGAYLNIAMRGEGGHAIAAFVGSSAWGKGTREILFFDPNIGEVWFEDIQKFGLWFTKGFMMIMSRKGGYSFTSFDINAFAQKARKMGR